MTDLGSWTTAEIVIAVAFTAWLIASIANQLPGDLCRWLKRRDVIAAIPAWTFFAPNPGRSDYFLLYRDRSPDGHLGPWRVVAMEGKDGLLSALWNPLKRKNKALTDMVSELLFLAARYRKSSLVVTMPYVVLLNVVSSQRRTAPAEATQFAVFETFGFHNRRSPEIVFESDFHRLGQHR